jgi:hypothetical protein
MMNTKSAEEISNLVFSIKQNMNFASMFFSRVTTELIELDEKLLDLKEEQLLQQYFEKSKIGA